LLSGLAYTLCEGWRSRALENTSLAKASPNRIRLLLSGACPHQELFRTVAFRLNSS